MQLLILFLFLIQFVFCSGVELLQNPGQLTPKEANTGKNIQSIEGLNKALIGIMNLFDSTLPYAKILDQNIIQHLNNNYNSIQQQYNNLFIVLGLLNYKFNLINEYINKHPNVELTLNIQQQIPEPYKTLKNNNIYMQNIIILAMNLIKSKVNVFIFSPKIRLFHLNQKKLLECLNKFKDKANEYINIFQNQTNQNILIYFKNQVHDIYLTQLILHMNLIPNQVQQGGNGGGGRGNAYGHGRGGH